MCYINLKLENRGGIVMENKKSHKKEYLIAAIILIAAIAVLLVVQNRGTKSKEDLVKVQVEVINESQSYEKTYDYETNKTSLGDLLAEEGIIEYEDSDYGRFITGADGMTADSSKEEWWNVLVNGESASTGIDGIEIHEGDVYTLQLVVGY